MGFLDSFLNAPPAGMDWNGDGVIDSWDAGIETGVILSIQQDQDREHRIRTMVRAIADRGSGFVDNTVFEELCWQNGLRMSDFEQDDISEIARRLRDYGTVEEY